MTRSGGLDKCCDMYMFKIKSKKDSDLSVLRAVLKSYFHKVKNGKLIKLAKLIVFLVARKYLKITKNFIYCKAAESNLEKNPVEIFHSDENCEIIMKK